MKIKILSTIFFVFLLGLVITAPLQALGHPEQDLPRRLDDGSTYFPDDLVPPVDDPQPPGPVVGDLAIGEVRGKDVVIPIQLPPLATGQPIDPSVVIVSDKTGNLSSLLKVSTGAGNQPALESSFDLGNGLNVNLSWDMLGGDFSWSLLFGD